MNGLVTISFTFLCKFRFWHVSSSSLFKHMILILKYITTEHWICGSQTGQFIFTTSTFTISISMFTRFMNIHKRYTDLTLIIVMDLSLLPQVMCS